jgi:hypothetical protein
VIDRPSLTFFASPEGVIAVIAFVVAGALVLVALLMRK